MLTRFSQGYEDQFQHEVMKTPTFKTFEILPENIENMAQKYFRTQYFYSYHKNVIFLSGDNAIKDHWTCATQSLLSSFVTVKNILHLCSAT